MKVELINGNHCIICSQVAANKRSPFPRQPIPLSASKAEKCVTLRVGARRTLLRLRRLSSRDSSLRPRPPSLSLSLSLARHLINVVLPWKNNSSLSDIRVYLRMFSPVKLLKRGRKSLCKSFAESKTVYRAFAKGQFSFLFLFFPFFACCSSLLLVGSKS